MITALTVFVPMLGGLMSEYLHWSLIVVHWYAWLMYVSTEEAIFTFKQTKLTTLKENFDVVIRDVPLLFKMFKVVLRSIIVNFNTNLALFY